MVNHDGVVFEKNLGPGGNAVARNMHGFDPDARWRPVPRSAAGAGAGPLRPTLHGAGKLDQAMTGRHAHH
jgi:Protein of unknown function (DUF2950)